MRLFRKKTKRYRGLVWKPQSDITAYELAQCLEIWSWADRRFNVVIAYDLLPPEAQRHFVVKEVES